MIIKKINLFFSITLLFLVFLVFFLIHVCVLSYNQVQLTSSFIFPSYIFNFIISILVLIVITKLGKSKSFYVLGYENLKLNTISFNDDEGVICLQSKEILPNRISLIPDQFVNPAPIPQAIQDVIETNLQNDFMYSAISDFLFREKPRFLSGPKNPILEPSLKEN